MTKTKPITTSTLRAMKQNGEKIAMLTAYDASFATILDQQGVDVVLVGDSLGMVIHGRRDTISVSVDDMIYHARAVSKASKRALLLVDLPFMSYTTKEQALKNAARLMQEGFAHMVKIEGGGIQIDIIECLSAQGIPVCAHLGLQPQSVHKLGGFQTQGNDQQQAEQILNDALVLEAAGADLLVLECIPAELAKVVSQSVKMPVIGIGAGAACDGQVLVLYDLLGISGWMPRFAKNFLAETGSISKAVQSYVVDVKEQKFPSAEQSIG